LFLSDARRFGGVGVPVRLLISRNDITLCYVPPSFAKLKLCKSRFTEEKRRDLTEFANQWTRGWERDIDVTIVRGK
jgi:hypothetical protein